MNVQIINWARLIYDVTVNMYSSNHGPNSPLQVPSQGLMRDRVRSEERQRTAETIKSFNSFSALSVISQTALSIPKSYFYP